MPKLPWLKFYPNDWLSDEALRPCSLPARALWVDMLCLMHKNARRGYLLQGGQPMSHEQLARVVGEAADVVLPLLQELQSAGVVSVSDQGAFYSRRMLKEEAKRSKCSRAGKMGGGNPSLGQSEPLDDPLNTPLASSLCTSREKEIAEIYQYYPRKVARSKAMESIAKAIAREVKSQGGVDEAIAFLFAKTRLYGQIAKKVPREDRQFIPYPATWFNQERYHDEMDVEDKAEDPSLPRLTLTPEQRAWAEGKS